MNYIDSIILENFQSHKKTTINPAGPGHLTVIVGLSDSGKTAIIRGLRWLAYNSPSGTDFIRVGTQQASVSAIMANSERVTRTRSRGGVNRYILEDIEHPHPRVFESFGIGVPLEIQQALEMAPISIGDMEFNLNLSEQLDGPFLGNSTPATVRAKVLGKLSGVEEVDHANKTLGTDLYRKRREKEGIENQIQHLAEQIEAYNYLDGLGPLIEVFESSLTSLKKKIEKKQQLLQLSIKLAGIKAAIGQEEEKLANLRSLDIIAELLQKAVQASVKHQTLVTARTEQERIRTELQTAEQILQETQDTEAALELVQNISVKNEKLKSLFMKQKALEWLKTEQKNTENVLKDTQNIDNLIFRIQRLTETQERRSSLGLKQALLKQKQQDIDNAEAELRNAKNQVKFYKQELAKIYEEAAICPLCGGTLNPEKLLEEVV